MLYKLQETIRESAKAPAKHLEMLVASDSKRLPRRSLLASIWSVDLPPLKRKVVLVSTTRVNGCGLSFITDGVCFFRLECQINSRD